MFMWIARQIDGWMDGWVDGWMGVDGQRRGLKYIGR